mmetsp:Transcript_23105/g.16436  ORF Transcript_23105/g.16436 Transcript_23105/m.16436 type:complete len:100 (+) Transcript_23105:321-620(+)
MTVPIPSVAVINGHAFAGGIILALAHDFRIMNTSNKGLICLSEINIGLALPTAYNEFIKRTMNPQAARMLSFGQAITPKQAQGLGFLSQTYKNQEEAQT